MTLVSCVTVVYMSRERSLSKVTFGGIGSRLSFLPVV